jgi:Tfp pilus assembly protein PilN
MTALNSRMGASGQRVWMGGFNLLPYRRSNARRARRRCLIEWLVAALVGCVALSGMAGWQLFERARVDSQRVASESVLTHLTAPLAEHARLSHDADERGKRIERAVVLSKPLTRLLDLLDSLSNMPAEGVVLQQLRQRVHETELLATSRNPVSSADWLKQLSAVRGVKNAEVTDLHPQMQRAAGAQADSGGVLEFAARLRWDEEVDHAENARQQRTVTALPNVSKADTRAAQNPRGAP